MITADEIKAKLKEMGFTKEIFISEPELTKGGDIWAYYSTNKEAFDSCDDKGIAEGCNDFLVGDDEDALWTAAKDIIMDFERGVI